MSTRLKALKTLVMVRERQGAALQQALEQARQALADAHAELSCAQQAQRDAQDAEATARDELDTLTRGSFTPEALRAIDFRIEDRRAEVANAARQVRDRQAGLGRAETAVAEATQSVRVNERRIEGFREQIEKLVREREAAIEEMAEEETEEASTARFVARVRAAAEASHG